MRKLAAIIAVLLQVGAAGKLAAQVDPHFSQYYAYPLWLNPALTGVMDGDTRVGANFRDQWATIDNGYRTGALSVDFRPTEKVGVGFNVLNQAAGTAGYNYFAAYGSFSYAVPVGNDDFKKLHFGLQAGIINRSFDPGKAQFDDQYNPVLGFDPNLPSFENFGSVSSIVFDSSAGIFYDDTDPQKTTNIFAGVSVAHLNSPNDPFATGGISSPLPFRFTVHGGVKIRASDFFDITPHAIYIRQQNNQIRAIGVYSELKTNDDRGLILGGMYRVNDAAVANVGYHLDSMIIGLSYDFNTSALQAATNGQGGFELSVSYVFNKRKIGYSQICPRL